MNVWTDIAIGNLLRKPPDPRDLEERFVCVKCGVEKPDSDYSIKGSDTWGFARDKTCRVCRNAVLKKKNYGRPVAPRRTLHIVKDIVAEVLREKPVTMRDLYPLVRASRRTAERAVMQLMREGLAEQVGFVKRGINDKVPLYGLKPAPPAERNSK